MLNFVTLSGVCVCVIFVDPVVADDAQKCNVEFMQRSEVRSFCCKFSAYFKLLLRTKLSIACHSVLLCIIMLTAT